MTGLQIILEPGRHLVAPAGALLTRVIDVKEQFVVMDAGITEITPDALQRVPSGEAELSDAALEACDIVGPLCESSDTRQGLDAGEAGGLFAVLRGAYGLVMASNYNRRLCRPKVTI